MTRDVVIALILLSSLCVALWKPKYLFMAAVFLAPMQSLDFDVGLRVTFYRAMVAILLLHSISYSLMKRRHLRQFAVATPLILFILYTVGISVIQINSLPDVEVIGGSLRAPTARAVFQILYFALMIGPLFLARFYLRDVRDFNLVAKTFICSLLTLAVLGWLQLFLWYSFDWNVFPLRGVAQIEGDPSLLFEGTFQFAGLDVHRMNSLGGEPKNLGQVFAVGLVLIQIQWGTRSKGTVHRLLEVVWIVLFISLLFTFSTSGLYLWLTASGVQLVVGLSQVRRQRSKFLRGLYTFASTILLAGLISLAIMSTVGLGFASDLIKERTIERAGIEDFDETIVEFLKNEPEWLAFGVGLGNVHIYANNYLADYAESYAKGTAFRAKTGTLKLLSEVGFVGLLLWIAALISQIKKLHNAGKALKGPPNIALHQACVVLLALSAALSVGYFAIAAIEELLFLTLGLGTALVSLTLLKSSKAASLLGIKRTSPVVVPHAVAIPKS